VQDTLDQANAISSTAMIGGDGALIEVIPAVTVWVKWVAFLPVVRRNM
jgi:hypothetical protein